jgi:hypothetical protein
MKKLGLLAGRRSTLPSLEKPVLLNDLMEMVGTHLAKVRKLKFYI